MLRLALSAELPAGFGGDGSFLPASRADKMTLLELIHDAFLFPKAPPAKISKEMREGKEPLRTFGDLMQFLEKKNDGEAPAAS
jgi:hypothetical protein